MSEDFWKQFDAEQKAQPDVWAALDASDTPEKLALRKKQLVKRETAQAMAERRGVMPAEDNSLSAGLEGAGKAALQAGQSFGQGAASPVTGVAKLGDVLTGGATNVGGWMEEKLNVGKPIDPVAAESIPGKLSQAAGSTVGFIVPAGVAGTAAGMSATAKGLQAAQVAAKVARAQRVAAGTLGAVSQAGEQGKEALDAGASGLAVAGATLGGAAVGATEAISAPAMLGNATSKAGQAITAKLAKGIGERAARTTVGAGAGALTEGFQEGVQSVGSDQVARLYDPEAQARGIGETALRAGENAALGAVVGGGMGGFSSLEQSAPLEVLKAEVAKANEAAAVAQPGLEEAKQKIDAAKTSAAPDAQAKAQAEVDAILAEPDVVGEELAPATAETPFVTPPSTPTTPSAPTPPSTPSVPTKPTAPSTPSQPTTPSAPQAQELPYGIKLTSGALSPEYIQALSKVDAETAAKALYQTKGVEAELPLNTRAGVAQGFKRAFNLSDEEAVATTALVEARAAKLGQPFGEYASNVFQGFENSKGKDAELMKRLSPAALKQIQEEVFHGTAAEFDAFSLSKLLTGEGTNNQGAGFYFTKSKTAAKFYAKQAEGLAAEGKMIPLVASDVTELYKSLRQASEAEPLAKEVLYDVQKYLTGYPATKTKTWAGLREHLTQFYTDDFIAQLIPQLQPPNKKANIYKALIDATEHSSDAMLSWDGNVSEEQLHKIQAQAEKEGSPELSARVGARFDAADQTGHTGEVPGESVYTAVAAHYLIEDKTQQEAELEASLFLARAGFIGHRYTSGHNNENFVIFDPKYIKILSKHELGGKTLSQAAQGAVQFGKDGKASLFGFSQANVSTAIHELAHVFRQELGTTTPQELADAEAAFGVQDGNWETKQEELFARTFENWTRTGVTTNTKLQRVFESFKKWITDIYKGMINSPIDVDVSPEMAKFFDKMLGGQAAEKAKAGVLGFSDTFGAPMTSAQLSKAEAIKQMLGKGLDETTPEERAVIPEAAEVMLAAQGVEVPAGREVEPYEELTGLNDDAGHGVLFQVQQKADAIANDDSEAEAGVLNLENDIAIDKVRSRRTKDIGFFGKWIMRPEGLIQRYAPAHVSQAFSSFINSYMRYHNAQQEWEAGYLNEFRKYLPTKEAQLRFTKVLYGEEKLAENDPLLPAMDYYKKITGYFHRQIIDGKLLNLYAEDQEMFHAVNSILNGLTTIEQEAKANKLDKKTLAKEVQSLLRVQSWNPEEFVSHIENGHYVVQEFQQDEDGKGSYQTVIRAKSEQDAHRKLLEQVKSGRLGPDGDYQISNSADLFGDPDFKISKAAGFRLLKELNKLAKSDESAISKEDKKALQSLLTKPIKFKKLSEVYAGALQKNEGHLRGEDNVMDTLLTYSRMIHKKVNLDPAIITLEKTLPSAPPNVQKLIENSVAVAKGRYATEDKVFDGIMKYWREHALDFSANKGPLVQKLGERVAAALDLQPGTYTSVAKAATWAQGNLKLGYRLAAPIMQRIGGGINNWASTTDGSKWFGFGEMWEAHKWMRTEEGKQVLNDESAYLGTMSMIDGTDIKPNDAWWKPLGFFNMGDIAAKREAYAMHYLIEKKVLAEQGVAPEHLDLAARQNARMQIRMSQHIRTAPSDNGLMQTPTGKVILQFKNYPMAQMEFLRTRTPQQWAKWIAANTTLFGPAAAVLTVKSLPIIGHLLATGFGKWGLDELQRLFDTGEWFKAYRGAAGYAGVDLSASASLQFPKVGYKDAWFESLGPTFGDVMRLHNTILSDDPDDSAQAWAEKAIPFYKWWSDAFGAFKNDGTVTDARGNKIYEMDNMAERALTAAGLQPVGLSRNKSLQRIAQIDKKKFQLRQQAVVSKFADKIMSGNMERDIDLERDMIDYAVNASSIRNEIIRRKVPLETRMLMQSSPAIQAMLMPTLDPMIQDQSYMEEDVVE